MLVCIYIIKLLNAIALLSFLFIVAEGYWLKQSSISPYAGSSFTLFIFSYLYVYECKVHFVLVLFRNLLSWMVILLGSMYHGSPILLSLLGPLTVIRYPFLTSLKI